MEGKTMRTKIDAIEELGEAAKLVLDARDILRDLRDACTTPYNKRMFDNAQAELENVVPEIARAVDSAKKGMVR